MILGRRDGNRGLLPGAPHPLLPLCLLVGVAIGEMSKVGVEGTGGRGPFKRSMGVEMSNGWGEVVEKEMREGLKRRKGTAGAIWTINFQGPPGHKTANLAIALSNFHKMLTVDQELTMVVVRPRVPRSAPPEVRKLEQLRDSDEDGLSYEDLQDTVLVPEKLSKINTPEDCPYPDYLPCQRARKLLANGHAWSNRTHHGKTIRSELWKYEVEGGQGPPTVIVFLDAEMDDFPQWWLDKVRERKAKGPICVYSNSTLTYSHSYSISTNLYAGWLFSPLFSPWHAQFKVFLKIDLDVAIVNRIPFSITRWMDALRLPIVTTLPLCECPCCNINAQPTMAAAAKDMGWRTSFSPFVWDKMCGGMSHFAIGWSPYWRSSPLQALAKYYHKGKEGYLTYRWGDQGWWSMSMSVVGPSVEEFRREFPWSTLARLPRSLFPGRWFKEDSPWGGFQLDCLGMGGFIYHKGWFPAPTDTNGVFTEKNFLQAANYTEQWGQKSPNDKYSGCPDILEFCREHNCVITKSHTERAARKGSWRRSGRLIDYFFPSPRRS